MKKAVALVVGLVVLCPLVAPGISSAATSVRTGDRVPGILIVKFAGDVVPRYDKGFRGNSTMGLPSVDQLNAQFQLTSFRRLFPVVQTPPPPKRLPDLGRYHILHLSPDVDLDKAADAYRSDPAIEAVEFDTYALMEAVPSDSLFGQMWNLRQASDHDVDADLAWDQTSGSPTVILGVTDTGVLYDHPDLRDNVWVNPGEDIDNDGVVFDPDDMNGIDDDGNGYVDDLIGWDFVEAGFDVWPGEDGAVADNDPKDFNGHGTHTSGTIAAVTNNVHGVSGLAGGFGPGAPGCKIMCLRMGWSFDYYGSEYGVTEMSYVAEAFVYAANMGARAINYSFGSGTGGGIEAATDYAVASGVTICAAAGNDGSSSGLGYLQSRSDVICVASTDENDGRSYFSNYGPLVDVSAPGSDIWSTVSLHYSPGYAVHSGTSMAAPHVVGVTGLILSANPGLTRSEVLNVITSTADSTADYIGQMGAGRINAYRAVLEAKAFRISHIPLGNTGDAVNPYTVVATIHSDTTLNADSLSLFYRSSAVADTSFVRVQLLPTGNPEEYGADIPPQPVYSVVEYGLTAEDARGERVAAPDGFPTSTFSFRVLGIPILASYPDSFGVDLPSGYTDVETLVVRNDGTDDLLFSLGVGRLDTSATGLLVRAVIEANANAPAASDPAAFFGQTGPPHPVERASAAGVLAGRARFASSAGATIRAAVLDSWGTDYGTGADWDYLNANYGDFGSTPILIDYTTFNHESITYEELAANGPDVLIVSDAWGPGYGWEFTSAELAAIRRYVEEGHGLFVTAGTLDSQNAPNHVGAFAMLLGLDSSATYNWAGNAFPQHLRVAGHPLFERMPDPYDATFPLSVNLTGQTWLEAATRAEVVAASTDHQTATTVFRNRVYTSIMPEEESYYGQAPADDQFVYNAIVYCASGVCDWLSAEPVAGAVPPGDSVFVNVRLDARPFHQDTTLSCQINLQALDSVGSNVAIPVRMHVLPPDYYVDLSPTSAASVGPARDTVWYADTLTNFGAHDDFYHLIGGHAQWPTSVWDSSGTAEITTTPILSQDERYVIRPRVIIPEAAVYGQADTLQLTVRSDGDPMIAPQFAAVTYSTGRLDSVPWLDQFPALVLDTLRWRINEHATVSDRGIDPPSPPYSLNLNGDPDGGDMVTSVPINLAGQIQVVLSYWYERTGGGAWVYSGHDLIFEVLDDSSRWVEVSRQPGGGLQMTSFQHVEVILPWSAYHEDFRFRIRSIGSSCQCDDWFVDDVQLYAPIPPSMCHAPDSFAFNLAENDTTRDTLIVCNNGPGELRFKMSVRDDSPPAAGSLFPRITPRFDPRLHGTSASAGEPSIPAGDPVPPVPTGWGLVDDFEDGDFDGWQIGSGSCTREVTATTAAAGTHFSFMQSGVYYGWMDGVSRQFPAGQYAYAGFYVRTGATNRAAAYVVVGDDNTPYTYGSIFFLAGPSGRFIVYPGDESFPYEANRWYLVEFYLNWTTQRFDYYVDGNLIAPGLPFRNAASYLSQIHLFNADPATAWYDEIVIGDESGRGWLSLQPRADTIAAGETTRVALDVRTTAVGSGNYHKTIEIHSNDPYTPHVDIPVSLRVRGPEIVVLPDTVIVDYVQEGTDLNDIVRIANTGEEPLFISGTESDRPWLHLHRKYVRVGPGDSTIIGLDIDARRLLPGAYRGHVTIMSNDFDESEIVVPVLARVGPDPDIAVVPESLALIVNPDDTTSAVLGVQNAGLGTLAVWKIRADYSEWPGMTRVVESSPTFTSSPRGGDKPASDPPLGYQPDADALYTSAVTAVPPPVAGALPPPPGLETVRAQLNAGFASVTSCIPHRFDFSEGESGYYIEDGGNDMYDWGNLLLTNRGGYIDYANDSVRSSTYFGSGGRYFTRKYPGLFVLAADMRDVEDFRIYGSLGADGFGNADGAVLETSYGDRTFYGLVKRVYNAGNPSVNHLIIVEKWAWHSFSTYTEDDYDVVGLAGVDRLYYLLYAGSDGYYIDNAATLEIMKAFLTAAGVTPQWISVRPESLIVAPGSSANVTVRADARGLEGPGHSASLLLTTNDPDKDTLTVPVYLHVRSPEIAVRPTRLAMDALEGQATDSVLWIVNEGDGELQAVFSADSIWLASIPESLMVAPADSFPLTVRVDASALIPGHYGAGLTVHSNDYDEPLIAVPVALRVGPDPDIEVVPESLAVTLTVGDSLDTPLEIRNLGLGTLAFTASVVGLPGRSLAAVDSEPYPAWYYDPLPHDAPDNREGRSVTYGSGGPDSAGYRWIDSDDPEGPSFQWVDISSSGTEVAPLQPDGFNGPYTIGFDFPFYDSTYGQFWISTKGFIGFGPPDGYYYWTNTPLPSPSAPNNIIAWYWDDLRPTTGTNPTQVFYRREADRLIVQFTRYRHWCCYGPWITGEIIIYSSGRILAQTLEVQPGFSVNGETVGIESITGTDGLGVAFNTPYVHDSLAVQFSRLPEWLTVTPAEGRVAPQSAMTMNVHVKAGELPAPDYYADITLMTNDPDELTKAVPVHLHVRLPEISLRPPSFRMDVTEGSPADSILWIINSGDGDLHVAASPDSAWLVPIPESVTVAPQDSFALTVRVDGTALIPGECAATLTINSNDVDESELVVPILADVGPDPDIAVSPESLVVVLTAGDSVTAPLEIRNLGQGTLAFDLHLLPVDRNLDELLRSLTDRPAPRDLPSGPAAQNLADSGSREMVPTTIAGDFLEFDITPYGEIMPFQYPRGTEHLQVGGYYSGYTVAYRTDGVDNVAYAYYGLRGNVTPVTRQVLVDDGDRTEVEVIVETADHALRIARLFSFDKHDKFIRIRTTLSNISGSLLDDVILKSGADWDMDGTWGNDNWGFDSSRVMEYAFESHYASIVPSTPPAVLDVNGWNDFDRRLTDGDLPPGNYSGLDGLLLLHYEVGGLTAGQSADVLDAFVAGDDLADLQTVADRASQAADWLVFNPGSGRVPPGGAAAVDVGFVSSGLSHRDYYAELLALSNDPDEDSTTIPVHMHLLQPEIAVRPLDVTMEAIEGATQDTTLWVINSGDGDLHVTAAGDSAWLSGIPATVTATPADSVALTVRVDASLLVPGYHVASLVLLTNDAGAPRLIVPVHVHVGPNPEIVVAPESLLVSLVPGDSITTLLEARNVGSGTLVFTATVQYLMHPAASDYAPIPPVLNPVAATPPSEYGVLSSEGPGAGSAAVGIPFPGNAAGVTFSRTGQLYAAGRPQNRIMRRRLDGSWEEFSTAVNSPYGIAFSRGDELAVAEYFNQDVVLVRPDGSAHPLVSGLGIAPLGLAYGYDRALYVTTEGTGQILRIAPDGALSTFAYGVPWITYAAAFGADGRLYVSTYDDGRILAIEPDGSWSTYATIGQYTEGLAFDVAGNLYCANGYDGFIYRIEPDQTVDIIGTGFTGSRNLALDATGLLYISTLGAPRIDTLRVGIPGVPLPVSKAEWLTVQPTNGRVPPGSADSLAVHVDTEDLLWSDCYARITLATNDPDEDSVVVPVHLHLNTTAACVARCHGDPQCDGVATVQDVVKVVNVAFRGGAPIPDPSRQCPYETTDVNCDGSTNVIDVVKLTNVAFRSANPATEFCRPCAR